ncbi:MAG: hypothetical protein M1823_002063 [Watsoniomyces obsoletus]|nr:MAG: hypothetical protein M1823_002063 [Watsoniomyces obsoletus]
MSPTPPHSPTDLPPRPRSTTVRQDRSESRTSTTSRRNGAGSRASDDDGKTAVRVAVRVRPPLRPTDPGFDLIPQRFQRSIAHVTSPTGLAVEAPQGRKLFIFDRVFGEDVTQEGVWEYLSESVDAFVQGYNVSVLAYGQSGSGKSYTMGTSGPTEQNDAHMKGVVPRAAAALFAHLGPSPRDSGAPRPRAIQRYSLMAAPAPKPDPDRGWTLKATYVEIYNEQLRDLLLPDHVPAQERGPVIIREDAKGRIVLTGLHQVNITSIDDMLDALNFGSAIRQTDATAINAKSSRSHAVFSLHLVQRRHAGSMGGSGGTVKDKRRSVPIEAMSGPESSNVTLDSKLHFVDLAGSERLKNTGAQGDRAKEGISINAGLASLGKVISQLSTRQPGAHVSYRDSKLTRLLQDSLGGNAVTYMVACVTPAEFHLSETLNTVQYAQRARAIQSKPQIQQISDDSDKQALIDRLRAEVAFLRDRIRSAERSERSSDGNLTRGGERHTEREVELQNQLLDFQESYSALGQRHAKLIAEVAKAQDGRAESDRAGGEGVVGTALERLKRSNSFAEVVEQVLLEYEKTIQTLESSLAHTRSSLSTTESDLLEKETRCAYTDTVNQQLEARLQKMMDREASTEHYLHELEHKLDGHTSGEEKNAAIVAELRKEISRVRENEANSEDYISTLEERLAEADQDAELMQREIDRLEHVVERQRGLGKLDALMQELDQAQVRPGTAGSRGGDALAVPHAISDDAQPADSQSLLDVNGDDSKIPSGASTARPATATTTVSTSATTAPVQSVAQSEFVAEKLDTVTQELLDLRVEHEHTVNEFERLSSKYEDAMRTLGQLQDAVDEARHPPGKDVFATPASTRPSSFLGDARVTELREGTQLSSSRSLSSELYLAGESPNTSEPSDVETAIKGRSTTATTLDASPPAAAVDDKNQPLLHEVTHLKRLQAEKDERLGQLTEQYDKLQHEYQDILDEVEDLKTEVSKAKMNGGGSGASPIIRRKSSQGVMMVDRAHRSFASLRNIATENLEDRPDAMQSFEINLNSAMHELYARSERVQALETEIATVKKEMETKMAIISGLTRERSSMNKSSPMDMSVVSTMRDQLLQSENKIRVLQETQSIREKTLLAEIEELRGSLENMKAPLQTSAEMTPDVVERFQQQDRQIVELQGELDDWERRHEATVESMQTSESKLLATIQEMEAAMTKVQPADDQREDDRESEEMETMRRAIDEYSSSLDAYARRVEDLERGNADARRQLEESARAAHSQEAELESHRELVAALEQRLAEHEAALRAYEERMQSTQESHERQLNELRRTTDAALQDRLNQQAREHQDIIRSLQGEVTEARDEMGRLLQGIAGILEEETAMTKVIGQVQRLVEQRAEAESRRRAATDEADRAKGENAKLKATVLELSQLHDQSTREIERLNEQYQKSSRIVEDLEEQLTANFDQHQATNNRLSVLESERNHRLDEIVAAKNQALAELEAAKEETARLEAKMYQPPTINTTVGGVEETRQRSSSITSNLRKSASAASLPSPPPAIPLPPLPHSASPAPNGISGHHAAGVAGPPTTPGRRELATSQAADDHEARLRTIENALFAEKQLNFALEEALGDLEAQGKRAKEDLEAWKKKAVAYEEEIESLKSNQRNNRYSMQAVEEARTAHRKAEAARLQLEERMNALNKKKKKGSLNCF